MTRPALPIDERQKRRQQRNAAYYQRTKAEAAKYHQKSVVYVISGLEDGKHYVGVSNNFSQRSQAHRLAFGQIQIAPVLIFKMTLDLHQLDRYVHLVMLHIGIQNCVNILPQGCGHAALIDREQLEDDYRPFMDTITQRWGGATDEEGGQMTKI